MEHTIESLIFEWRKVDNKIVGKKGISPLDTRDPALLAGCYLDWAGSNLQRAIRYVEAAASDKYIDMPRFPGCDETLLILRKLEHI